MKTVCLFFFAWLLSLTTPLTANAAHAKLSATLRIPVGHQFDGMSLSADGKMVAYVDAKADTTGNLFLCGRNQKPRVLVAPVVTVAAFSPKGNLLAYVYSLNGRSFVCLYDVKRHKLLRSVALPVNTAPGCICFSADGTLLACSMWADGYHPCVIRLYRVPTLIPSSILEVDTPLPNNMAFSDNKEYFAASGFAGDAGVGGTAVWSLGDHRLRQVLPEYGRIVFASDQHTLVCNDKTLDVRIPHGKLQSFANTGHRLHLIGKVRKNQALFCQNTIRQGMKEPLELWNISPRKKIKQWSGVGYFSFGSGLSADGKTFADTCTDHGQWVIKIWHLDS